MMAQLDKLEEKRKGIVGEMAQIHSMRKGSLSAATRTVTHKDGTVVHNGPYHVLTYKGPDGKTNTESVRTDDLVAMQQEVDSYRHFRALTDNYIKVCEDISRLEQGTLGAKKNS
jgi:hypothetical protein